MGIIGAIAFFYGCLHTYAAATGETAWMVLGALGILYEFGGAPLKLAVVTRR